MFPGHVRSEGEERTDPRLVASVRDFPRPAKRPIASEISQLLPEAHSGLYKNCPTAYKSAPQGS